MQRTRRFLGLHGLLGQEGLALLDLGFAQAAAVGAPGVDIGKRPALLRNKTSKSLICG
jgi:hypothetical protein